ncbi:MAG: hypothetical protein AB7P03_08140 [Kofleriaceae bacterium]
MKRCIALLTVAALAVGCTKNGALMVGTALTGAGIVMTAAADPEPCEHCLLDADGSVGLAVERAVGLSVALFGLGLIAISGRLPETLEPAQPVQAPALAAQLGAPGSVVSTRAQLGAPGSLAAEPLPAQMVLLTSRLENRLLLQASTAARSGQCNAAVMTGKELAGRDPQLHTKLLDNDPPYAACVARAQLLE